MNSRIKYVIGDATVPPGDQMRIIAHCMNNVGAHDAGFARALDRRYPFLFLKSRFRLMYQRKMLQLGVCLTMGMADMNPLEPEIVAMIAQDGLGPTSLRLPDLATCLQDLAAMAIETNASVHMPRIGCGLAGGKWEDVEPLILDAFGGALASFVPITVYDLPAQKVWRELGDLEFENPGLGPLPPFASK